MTSNEEDDTSMSDDDDSFVHATPVTLHKVATTIVHDGSMPSEL